MLSCVVDPGVLIAARLSGKGAPSELIRRWLTGEIEVVVSPQLLDELQDMLSREKFRRWLTEEESAAYVQFLRLHARLVPDPVAEHGHSRDPDDDYLVTLARSVRASALISGDSDLTGITAPSPKVLTPRELIEALDRLPHR
jgi:uncharacterized protein